MELLHFFSILALVTLASCQAPPADDELVRCPRCLIECAAGQVPGVAENGCPTCECVAAPVAVDVGVLPVIPPEPAIIPPEPDFIRCGPLCRMYCNYGFKKNATTGCPYCACNPNPCEVEGACGDEQRCETVEIEHQVYVAQCSDAEPVRPRGCLLAACDVECPFGLMMDSNGCHTCECKPDPCETTLCDQGHVCKLSSENQAQCILQSLCEQARSSGPRLLGGSHQLACTRDGQFEPTQCYHVTGDCWCVDDTGKEVEGTRRNVREEGTPINCPVNTTTSLHGHVSMEHDLDDLEQHLETLHDMMHDMLSHWLVVSRRYITVVEITPNHANIHLLEVDFVVSTDENAAHDLATSSHHLQSQVNSLQMQYQGHILKPATNSLSMHHQYQPMLPPVGVIHRQASFYRQHQMALLAGLIGITFFVVVLYFVVQMLVGRRRTATLHFARETPAEPRDLYKQNLKFSGKLTHVGDEDRKVVLTDAEAINQDIQA